MSMHPQAIAPIPEETVRVAHAALPRSNTYLTMRDQLGIFYNDLVFAPLFSERGRPAEAPWQVALVCVFQFLEGLSDRQAAEAVRTRIDWKYALGLRRSRSIGQKKTHLQHVLTAGAINLVRFASWKAGVPHAKTRTSRFATLKAS